MKSGRKIYVVGPSASGKTQLARLIASKLDFPHFQLDDVYINTDIRQGAFNLKLRSKAESKKRIESILKQESWVVDGVYVEEELLEQADTVVLIHLPVLVCLYYQWLRTFSSPRHRKIFPLTNDIWLSLVILQQHFPFLKRFSYDGIEYATISTYKGLISREKRKGKKCWVFTSFDYEKAVEKDIV